VPVAESQGSTVERAKVLIVDDEAATRGAVAHALRRRFEVLGAGDGDEALALLAAHDVAVVLCDQRLPGLSGEHLVTEIRQRHPDVVRLLVTGHYDDTAFAHAVNHGQIFGFLRKPWNEDELERTIDSAMAWRRLRQENARIGRELEASNERLTRLNAELRHFTHAVAHDLKEPLRTIQAFSQFLADDLGDRVDEDATQYLSGIGRCTGHLMLLVDDLLRLSELENVPMRIAETSLDEVFAQVRSLLHSAVEDRGGALRVQTSMPVLEADSGRLVTLFQNLVANGLKFNTAPMPTVEVTACAVDSDCVEIAVRDNGIGIPAEHQTRIFNIFHRLHRRSEYPGTGAGLAIVRKIVEAHWGSVHVDSAEGEGAVFRVRLPLRHNA
jgi:light-regulated signal transduction histidine kinase (bacteriophytochrome)